MRRIVLLALTLFLSGCASTVEFPGWLESDDWRARYATCASAGEAYVYAIPLAARDQQEISQRFVPADPDHCLLYVVREQTAWMAPKGAHVFLYRAESAPAMPESFGGRFETSKLVEPVWLERHVKDTPRELRKAAIVVPEVFAMWELEPGAYVVDASLSAAQPFARATIECTAGSTLYWGVKTKGMTVIPRLRELDAREGQARARHRLVSAGIQPIDERDGGRPIIERKCPERE